MKHSTRDVANRFVEGSAYVLEVIAGIIIIAGIFIGFIPEVKEVAGFYMSGGNDVDFQMVLEKIFGLVIGVEFLKMLCRHDMDSVIEVILFTLARKLIVEHTGAADDLLIIITIAILFAIRKYFFIDKFYKE